MVHEQGPDAQVVRPRLYRLVRLARANLALLALPPLLLALAGYLISSHQAPVYTATGQVFFDPGSTAGTDPERVAHTKAALALSNQVIGEAAGTAGVAAARVRADVDVQPSVQANILDFTANGPTSARAESLVSAMMQAYKRVNAQQASDANLKQAGELASLRKKVLTQIADLKAKQRGGSDTSITSQLNVLDQQVTDLTQQEAQLRTNATLATTSGGDLSVAPSNAQQTAPAPLRSAVIGFLLGILLALAAVWARVALVRRPTLDAEVEAVTAAPVLAHFPSRVDAPMAPARNMLAASLDLSLPDEATVLALIGSDTAVRPDVAVFTASCLTSFGRRVVLADADTSGAALTDALAHRKSRGLTDVPPAGDPAAHLVSVGTGDGHRFLFLPVGRRRNEGAVQGFRWSSLPGILKSVSRNADVVVVTTSDGAHPGMSSVLAAVENAVIITEGRDLDELERCARQLREADVAVLGTVVQPRLRIHHDWLVGRVPSSVRERLSRGSAAPGLNGDVRRLVREDLTVQVREQGEPRHAVSR